MTSSEIGDSCHPPDSNSFDRYRLLHGPYHPPALRVGDRTVCLARDCDVVVTSWTDARISWPRCQPIGQRGGCGILVDEELARAVRCEAALAIRYWWGVNVATMAWWRRVLGVGRTDSEGSRRLIYAAAEATAEVNRGKSLPAEFGAERRRRAIDLNLAQFMHAHPPRPLWTAEAEAMLGTMPDAELARKLGRTVEAVRVRRGRLGIPIAEDRRVRWTAERDELIRRLPPAEAAWRLQLSRQTVYGRRVVLGVTEGGRRG